jgi:tripartite-type tricarboxylate transporter receptor subunit TctC
MRNLRRPEPHKAADPSMRHVALERLGQPFIIEHRPGAGGNIGGEALRMPPPTAILCCCPVSKTVPEFIAYAKDNPGKINMASNKSARQSFVLRHIGSDESFSFRPR